jgi:hypothetical protein
MRVDDVPLWLRPVFHTFGYGLGGLLQATSELTRQVPRWERFNLQDK